MITGSERVREFVDVWNSAVDDLENSRRGVCSALEQLQRLQSEYRAGGIANEGIIEIAAIVEGPHLDFGTEEWIDRIEIEDDDRTTTAEEEAADAQDYR